MTISVDRAFFHSGFLNAGTPLEIASTPVMAAPPDAKACSSRKMPDRRRPRRSATWSRGIGAWCEPAGRRLVRRRRRSSRTSRRGTRRSGTAKMPARLLHAAQVAPGDDGDEAERDRDPVRAQVAGNAEYSAATPADTDTATVRM